MKLRNKQTGEVKECAVVPIVDGYVNEYAVFEKAESLAELSAEWEDVPEGPKEYWYIRDDGSGVGYSPIGSSTVAKRREEIGNYFPSREEAEKAVEKLKAWKRLMDYWGTEILGWEIRDMPTGGDWQTVNVKLNVKARKEPMELLDILFEGGEE